MSWSSDVKFPCLGCKFSWLCHNPHWTLFPFTQPRLPIQFLASIGIWVCSSCPRCFPPLCLLKAPSIWTYLELSCYNQKTSGNLSPHFPSLYFWKPQKLSLHIIVSLKTKVCGILTTDSNHKHLNFLPTIQVSIYLTDFNPIDLKGNKLKLLSFGN